MPKYNIFLDSSTLIAGAISESGAAHVLLSLGESRDILLMVSELVIQESERSIARKSPGNLNDLRKLIKATNLRIVANPSKEEVQANLYIINDPTDVPILLATMFWEHLFSKNLFLGRQVYGFKLGPVLGRQLSTLYASSIFFKNFFSFSDLISPKISKYWCKSY